jgi:hypothetical protein
MRILPPVPLVSREAQEDFISCECNESSLVSKIVRELLLTNNKLNVLVSFVTGGQTIRKGTTVYIFIMGIHYDSNIFAKPERFDPDRFSKSSVTNEDHSPYAFIPFSAGSRNCIGQCLFLSTVNDDDE